MAEGVRKRGKTWSYYFDTAKINGERNKIEKGGFKTQKEAKMQGQLLLQNTIILVDHFHQKKYLFRIIWTTGLKMQ